MGCDVHMYAEILVPKMYPAAANGTPRIGFEWMPVHRQVVVEDSWQSQRVLVEEWYGGRNYHDFAILADVRNYSELTPLAAPKGIPEDASYPIRSEIEQWGIDGHSHSYLTLAELRASPAYWEGTYLQKGFVKKDVAEKYRETGETPQTWSGGVWGGGEDEYEEISWEESYKSRSYVYENLIPALSELKRILFRMVPHEVAQAWPDAELVYPQATPPEPVEDLPDEDLPEAAEAPQRVKTNYYHATDEDIRIVFFFDN